jgi:hypothetical protein
MEKRLDPLVTFLGVAATPRAWSSPCMDYIQPREVLRYVLEFTSPSALMVN